MAEDQQAPPPLEAALDADHDAGRARRNSLASAFLDDVEANFRWDRLLQPHGVAVHLSATHLCTQMRGVKEESSKTWTSFWRGSYEHEPAMREEFLQTLRFSRR